MKNDYNLDSITPASMNSLLQRMKTNDTLFQKYIEYNSVLWSPKLPDGKFRYAQLCSIEFPDLDDYYSCMSISPTDEPTSTPSDGNTIELVLTFLSFSAFILLL